MKILSFVLIILMLFLVGQPVCSASVHTSESFDCCQSSDQGCDDEKTPLDQDESGGCSNCNPFQSCSCCAMGILIPTQEFTPRAVVFLPTRQAWTQHLPHFPAAVYTDVWQPPKIV